MLALYMGDLLLDLWRGPEEAIVMVDREAERLSLGGGDLASLLGAVLASS